MNKKMLLTAIITLVIDQVFKSLVQIYNVNYTIINNFFNISYCQNTGAAWSILQGKQILLILISIVMLVVVYNMSFSTRNNRFDNFSYGILFGGILGNLIDRIIFGYVRDFLDFYIFGYNYPVFNVADMAIVISVVLILVQAFKGEIKKWKSK